MRYEYYSTYTFNDFEMAQSRKRTFSDGGAKNRTFYSKKSRSYSRPVGQKSKKNAPRAPLASDNKLSRNVQLAYYGYASNTLINASSYHAIIRQINDLKNTPYMGSDQYYGLFKNAYVKSVGAKVSISCNTSSAQLTCNVWIDDNGASSTGIAQSSERCALHGGDHKVGYYGANVGARILTFDVSESTYNVFKSGLGEEDNKQDDATAPTNIMYLHIEVFAGTTALAADATGLQVEYMLRADVNFHNPVELNISA